MSLSYSNTSVIGGPFDPGVISQLNRRKEVLKKINTRDSNDIKYLNSNTGWVRVMSSVDTIENGSTDAENRVLIGGTLSSYGGFNPGNENSSYKLNSTYGYIPTAGITSFQVQSQGTFGTLRTASFNFTVNSPEDFSKLEQIYLRPGFSILLEWGHTYYLPNSKDSSLSPLTNIFPLSSFFNSKKTVEDIEKDIAKLKGEEGGGNFFNYDAMFGIIKNFIWNYNGYTYECQVDIVSKGEIVESVRTSMAPLKKKSENADVKYESSQYGSELEGYFNLIASAQISNKFGSNPTPNILGRLR